MAAHAYRKLLVTVFLNEKSTDLGYGIKQRQRWVVLARSSKYAAVFVKPTRSGTVGRQPSSSCALLMSGWRCLGSSVGSGR